MSSTPPIDPAAQLQGERRRRFWAALGLVFALLVVVAWVYLSRNPPRSTVAQPTLPSGESVSALKISLPAAGAYRISQSDLRRAGWGASLQEPGDIQLLQRGIPQPFWIDTAADLSAGDDTTLVFYASPGDSLYSPDNVFILVDNTTRAALPGVFLEQDDSPNTSQVEPAPLPEGLVGGSYLAVQRGEQNELYRPQAEGDERWFWSVLSGGNSQEVTLDADNIALPATGGEELARLRVSVYSDIEAPPSPDHHLRLLVNDQQVADERWEGSGWHQIEAWFDAAWLVEGVNQITLEAPGDLGVVADLYHLDWVELAYPRWPQAQDDRLDFWSPGGSLDLTGFTAPLTVFDISEPDQVTRVTGVEESGGGFRFESQPGRHYLAVGRGGWLDPASLAPLALQPDLLSAAAAADYLAIGPADLLEPLQPLLKLREGQGFPAAAIPVQAIYDQFNHGFPEPQAIQRFLGHATQNWLPAPRFVLLVGDASYDPLGYQAPPEANRLPVPMIDTIYGGQTASDVDYVQVNQDGWPDLALGVLPARTADQVAVFVKKTLAYEQSLQDSTSPGSILSIADGQEPSFAKDAQAFIDLFGAAHPGEIYAPPAGTTDAAIQIGTLFTEGQALVAYFGHGSLKMWGKDRLFTVDDAAGLENIALPVVLNLTCLTGLYTHPEVESLADAFLFNPGGGAVAVLAPTSLTLAADQNFLTRPLVQEMLANPGATLGQVHLAARRDISLESAGQRDVMMTFLLFGDPALSLPLSPGSAAGDQ